MIKRYPPPARQAVRRWTISNVIYSRKGKQMEYNFNFSENDKHQLLKLSAVFYKYYMESKRKAMDCVPNDRDGYHSNLYDAEFYHGKSEVLNQLSGFNFHEMMMELDKLE